MKRRDVLILLFCYLLWGFQPLYWNICEIDPIRLLAARIPCACLFTLFILAVQKRLGALWEMLRDRRMLLTLLPTSLFLVIDWGVYMLAVCSGHILDSALGYYLNPLVTFAMGLVLFREQCRPGHYLALGVAMIGVVVSAVLFRSFSWYTVVLALDWAVYAAFQKRLKADSITSIAAETLILTPFALLWLIFGHGCGLYSALSGGELAFVLGSGVVTAAPMLLFAAGVERVPLFMVSFFQYLSPSFGILCGLLLGERITPAKWVSFAFIWAGILLFSAIEMRDFHKKNGK